MDLASLLVSVGGLAASIVGLSFAYLAHQAAKSAKTAATSAEDAAILARMDAQRALSRSIRTVDIERAIALINRLKELQHQGNWGAALLLYQDLRRTLSEIRASMPTNLDNFRNKIDEAVPLVRIMEDQVSRAEYESTALEDAPELSAILNAIQQDLEILQASVTFPDGDGGN